MADAPTPRRHDAPESSPWRQPVVWLMLLLLAAAVGGGVAIVIIASGDGAADTVAPDVRRTAQVQTVDLAPDALARTLRLSAVLRVDAEGGRVQVLPVTGQFDRATTLRLELHHPVRSSADLHVELHPDALGWQAAATPGAGHDWLVELVPPDGRWRLRGRLEKDTLATHLHPVLAGE